MAQQTINIGTTANDGTGDPLRIAFDKVNDNFTELYNDESQGEVNSIIAGDGISVDTATGNVTVTNTITNNNQLTNGAGYVDGSGTANYVPKWTDGDTIGNSVIYDDGTNVGIGTASPAFKLHIADTSNSYLKIERTQSGSESQLFLGVGPSFNQILSRGASTAGKNLVFETQGVGTEAMCITSTGNVGIGTSSPATLVQAVNDTNDSATFSSRWNSGGYWSQLEIKNYSSNLDNQDSPQFKIMHNFSDGLNNGYVGFHRGSGLSGGFLSLGSNGTERMRITSAGAIHLSQGTGNSYVGANAGNLGTSTGTNNSAFGVQALYSNTTGNNNVANGLQALRSNTTASNNTATGYRALYLNTTGASNVANGANTLYSNTTGTNNTANGLQALYSNTIGGSNTANGQQALFSNTTGSNNVANGKDSLFSNTTASYNTATGYKSLYFNTTGSNNVANGYASLYYNTTGTQNTANGLNALYSNTTGDNNTSIGGYTLINNTTGIGNTANGINALYSNTTGNHNTANGLNASYSNTTGSYNSAFGRNALYFNTTGSGNIVIGSFNNAGTYLPVFNITTQNNYISMGSTSVTNAYIQVAWTVTSDARDKTEIKEVPHGLDFVSKLKPISYKFKESRDSDVAVGDVKYGFKAQDILALEGANNVIIDTKDEDTLRYNESSLIPVLVNAIKELKAEIELLKNK